MERRFAKSGKNKMLLGVAGGIAEYFRIDPAIVRIVFLLLAFASGVGVLLYIVLALLMPRPEAAPKETLAVVKDNLKAAPREATEAGRRVVRVLRGPAPEAPGTTMIEPKPNGEEGTAPQQ